MFIAFWRLHPEYSLYGGGNKERFGGRLSHQESHEIRERNVLDLFHCRMALSIVDCYLMLNERVVVPAALKQRLSRTKSNEKLAKGYKYWPGMYKD
ncbi:hypothetical protein ACTXT7_004096 [Hymenolepis weldensis]